MPSFREQIALIFPSDRQALRQWLQENHLTSKGAWLKLKKKGTYGSFISYSEVVDELLCFGWIDSVPNKVDELHYKLMITPRKPKSGWSKVNKDKIIILEKEGLITPAGWQSINQAKADGSWDALDKIEALEMPILLAEALAQEPVAEANFQQFPTGVRKNIIRYYVDAKTEPTQQKRIEEIVAMAQLNLRATQLADSRKFKELQAKK